jgi:hypothetical protein
MESPLVETCRLEAHELAEVTKPADSQQRGGTASLCFVSFAAAIRVKA